MIEYLFCFFVRGLCVGKKWNEYGVSGSVFIAN
jgi:hypothetical protein